MLATPAIKIEFLPTIVPDATVAQGRHFKVLAMKKQMGSVHLLHPDNHVQKQPKDMLLTCWLKQA